MKNKKIIRLTEGQLKKIIENQIKQLNEGMRYDTDLLFVKGEHFIMDMIDELGEFQSVLKNWEDSGATHVKGTEGGEIIPMWY